jgi:hypothetical protein
MSALNIILNLILVMVIPGCDDSIFIRLVDRLGLPHIAIGIVVWWLVRHMVLAVKDPVAYLLDYFNLP